MSKEKAKIKIHALNPIELIQNDTLLSALAYSYIAVFNSAPDGIVGESVFRDQHKIEDVKARILAQTGAEREISTNSHLIVATTPWDESKHTVEENYIKVIIEDNAVAIVGCLYSMGDSSKDEIQNSVRSTAVLFKSEEEALAINENVDQAFGALEVDNFDRTLYIPETWVRKSYRGATGLELMTKLGDELMIDGKLTKNKVMFWTEKESQMYTLAKKHLKARDLYWFDEKQVLMEGNCDIIYNTLNKIKKYEKYNWFFRPLRKILRRLSKSWS